MNALQSTSALLVLATLSIGCSKSSSSAVAPAPPAANIAGVWETTTVCDESNCGGSPNDTSTDKITVIQEGSKITVRLDDGQLLEGSMSGLTVAVGGTVNEGGAQTTSNIRLDISEDGRSLTGTDNWTSTDGTSSCSGSCTLTGSLTDDPALDATGTWELSLDCNEDCGSGQQFESFMETWTLAQSGGDVTAETQEDGTLDGTIVGFTVKFVFARQQGNVTETATVVLQINANNQTLTGTWNWITTDGCTGACTITGERVIG